MKLGLFGARGDMRGLAYQTQGFAKWLKPDRIFGIEMTADGLSPYPTDWSAYPTCDWFITSRFSQLNMDEVKAWLDGLDVVIGAETFYKDEFLPLAQEMGVKTILQVNPEFFATHDHRRRPLPPMADYYLAPSLWMIDTIPDAVRLPYPVDRQVFRFNPRLKADRFVHVAGHKAIADRAGTRILMGVLKRMDDLDVVIRSQSSIGMVSPHLDGRLFEENVPHPYDLYKDADVIICPRRYGGNSLVMYEALSCGCPVIALDRIPENTWDGVLTISTRPRGSLRTKAGNIPLMDANGGDLLRLIYKLHESPDMVSDASSAANRYAEKVAWHTLLPAYQQVLEAVSHGASPDVLRGIVAPFL